MNFINEINDILWTYILIIMLLGCAVWFSIRTRFVQFRMLREMIILLSESAGKGFIFSGIRYYDCQPCGYGQLGRGGHRHRHRRTGSCFLDVGDRPAGSFERFYRIYPGTVI